MRSTLHLLATWLIFIAGSMGGWGVQADVVVVVAATNPISKLTSEQIAKIYLGKSATFPNGAEAIPLDQKDDSPIRGEFYRKVVKKSSSQLAAYWARIIFTGDGQPPQQMDNDQAIRKAVSVSAQAIGYMERGAVDRSVKIIFTP